VNTRELTFSPHKFDYKQTLDTIIRKFTNYRNTRKRQMDDHSAEIEALKVAAAAIIDLKTFSKGRAVFKREKHTEICARRAEILAEDPKASLVGAYQKALKELWGETNQRYWEQRAVDVTKDIHE
jgi:hypothetical protein